MSQPVIELSIGTPPQKFNISLDIKDNFYSCFLKNNLPNINSELKNKKKIMIKLLSKLFDEIDLDSNEIIN